MAFSVSKRTPLCRSPAAAAGAASAASASSSSSGLNLDDRPALHCCRGKRSHQDVDALAGEFSSVSLSARSTGAASKRRDTVLVVSVPTSTIYRWADADEDGRSLDGYFVVMVRDDGSRKAWYAPSGGHNLAWTLLATSTAYSLSPPGYEPQEVVHRASGPFATEPRSYLLSSGQQEQQDEQQQDAQFQQSLQNSFSTFRYRAAELNDIEPLSRTVAQ